MAEGQDSVADFKEEFKEEYLTCSMCQDVYTDPATLQCGHTYCRTCLTSFTKTQPDAVRYKVIPCPLRCKGTKVPNPAEPVEKWSQQIKAQFLINGLMEKFNSKTVSDRVVSSRKIDPRVDTRVDSDAQTPDLYDVTVLIVDGGETLVVTDFTNNCVKSFFTRNKRTDHSKLPLDSEPFCISQYKDNQVLVTMPWSDPNQIARVSVRPQLVLHSVINTSKDYYGLVVLNSSSLAASAQTDQCVDILDMEGRVMRSIESDHFMSLFLFPWYICVYPEGHLLVSDNGMPSLTCLTFQQGQVVWKYTPTRDTALVEPMGITTTPTGDVLLVDKRSNKIIQLSGSGQFVREILTSQDGINSPSGLYLDKHNSLFVCDRNGHVKQFKLSP